MTWTEFFNQFEVFKSSPPQDESSIVDFTKQWATAFKAMKFPDREKSRTLRDVRTKLQELQAMVPETELFQIFFKEYWDKPATLCGEEKLLQLFTELDKGKSGYVEMMAAMLQSINYTGTRAVFPLQIWATKAPIKRVFKIAREYPAFAKTLFRIVIERQDWKTMQTEHAWEYAEEFDSPILRRELLENRHPDWLGLPDRAINWISTTSRMLQSGLN